MDNKPVSSFPEASDMPNPEILAEYKFIITYDRYLDEPDLEKMEQRVMYEINEELVKDFTNKVEFLFDGHVKVDVKPLEQGSILGIILLVLQNGFTAAEFISKYKDFYDSLILLKNHLRAILNRILDHTPIQRTNRNVNVIYNPGPVIRVVPVVQREPPQAGMASFYSKALFIYLLVTNIVLTIVVFALVYHAVAAIYFKIP